MVTTECNLQCRYCFGEAVDDFCDDFSEFEVDYSLPKHVAYSLEDLARFCGKDPECVLTFYGGEPLLCPETIMSVMDSVKAKYFMIQTNGLLFDQLPREYVNRFHTILVSVDGDEALTDYYRGKGTFKRLVENLRCIMENGFSGELIARMTVMEQTDIEAQVKWLLDNRVFSFSSVHWQLNAGFWSNDFCKRRFKEWSETSYVPGMQRLVKFWVDIMEKKGAVLKLYPFLGVAQSLLRGEPSLLRCGAGWINYAVQTDGTIIPCPTMWGMRDYYLGNIRNAHPLKLEKVMIKNEPCPQCEELSVCGGRCLYANITKRWSPEAYALVCNTVKSLIQAVRAELPRIRRLILNGQLRMESFNFMKYNGCEIIP
jgi:putative peptide-modifying radical SAM enzyme